MKEKSSTSGPLFNRVQWGIAILGALGILVLGVWVFGWIQEARVLRKMVERLSADSRIAEVLVTRSELDELTKKIKTTIKFLEYSSKGETLEPRYFTFEGNLIQFQSLVVRFDDRYVKMGNRLRGKSVYLFMKAFMLDGDKTQSFDLTPTYDIPKGYKVPGQTSKFEQKIWEKFWTYALDPQARAQMGIKNAQIEAPGSLFLPGTIYSIKIEHDGGIRIDTAPVPGVLKGETIA